MRYIPSVKVDRERGERQFGAVAGGAFVSGGTVAPGEPVTQKAVDFTRRLCWERALRPAPGT